MRSLRVLTWNVHGNYLLYLTRGRHEYYVPFKPGRPEGYGGRGGTFPWGGSVHEVPAEAVRSLQLDCIVFQSPRNWHEDQMEVLSEEQRRLPRIYIEHDPPREHPTDSRHLVDDPSVLLVHVTPFNALMWDSGRTPTCVIDHGVFVPPGVRYTGEIERGIVVINNLRRRGRRLGADIFEQARRSVPLDLVGMGSMEMGGLGEIDPPRLAEFESHYRLYFHPIRYTSLGLALCEAMMLGMPVVGLATTEMATVIENGVSGYAGTDVDFLIERMKELLKDPAGARRLGEGARKYAEERFNIGRFLLEWDQAFSLVTGAAGARPGHRLRARESILAGSERASGGTS